MAKNSFIKKLERLSVSTSRIPNKAAVIAVNFSKERFVRKNWVDGSREPWQKRKRRARGSTLVQSGRLKRSIRKLQATSNYILIGTDVPYAQIHNEGGNINKTVTVKKHRRRVTRGRTKSTTTVNTHKRKMNLRIPKRRFIGESKVLARRIERMIEKEFKKALR